MNYEDLLIEADKAGLIVKEKPLLLSDGRIKGRKIAIRKDIPTLRKKADVLAEELGHYYTTTGRIVEQQSVSNRKQERAAPRGCGRTTARSGFPESSRDIGSTVATSTSWRNAWKSLKTF